MSTEYPHLSRRDFLRLTLKGMAGSLVVATSTAAIGQNSEPDNLQLVQVEIPIPNLPAAFDGYRIVNLADFHFGPALAYDTVMRGIEWTRQLAPDMVVLTGDYISKHNDDDLLYGALIQLSAPDGVWGVMGNHDYWDDIVRLRDVLRVAGVAELSNANVPITRRGEVFWLAGVDSVREEKNDLHAALYGIPDGAPTIALVHEPDFADQVAATGRVHLQLSGHSHGGHVRVPFIDIPVASHLIEGAQKYPHGLYQVGSMLLHTSAGLGWWKLPRLFAAPEVVEITLRQAKSQG